ncbi:MAG: peptide-methionine (S)-S-oxide reductase MsrA [Proteocatella sp.]
MNKEIYIAGGCFWGIQEYYSRVSGVKESVSGYANGYKDSPTYKEVCTGDTGHVETVKVVYDSEVVTLRELIEKFFKIVDPTQLNRQANDIGSQYRNGIYYVDETDKVVIEEVIESKRNEYSKPIVTEVQILDKFYLAEEYHQDYLKKNPGGYCHISFDDM